jgi:glycopeptide antibiotics resistance protein
MKINLLTHNNHFGCGIDLSLSLDLGLISGLFRSKDIDDLILGLFYGPLLGNMIINIDLVRAYENKGYQVILAKRLGLKMPDQLYLTDLPLTM